MRLRRGGVNLTRPSSVTDPDFGDLFWDAERLGWQGSAVFDGFAVELWVNTISYMTTKPPFDDETWDRTITPESRTAFAIVRRRYPAVREQFLQEALQDYPRWNDGEQISASEFARRMVLQCVTLIPDGKAELLFEDGGMFGGHAFILHLNANGIVFHEEMFG